MSHLRKGQPIRRRVAVPGPFGRFPEARALSLRVSVVGLQTRCAEWLVSYIPTSKGTDTPPPRSGLHVYAVSSSRGRKGPHVTIALQENRWQAKERRSRRKGNSWPREGTIRSRTRPTRTRRAVRGALGEPRGASCQPGPAWTAGKGLGLSARQCPLFSAWLVNHRKGEGIRVTPLPASRTLIGMICRAGGGRVFLLSAVWF